MADQRNAGGGVQGQAPGVPSGLQEHHLAAHNLQMPPEGGPFLQEGLVQSGPNMWMRPSSPSRLQNLRSDRCGVLTCPIPSP